MGIIKVEMSLTIIAMASLLRHGCCWLKWNKCKCRWQLREMLISFGCSCSAICPANTIMTNLSCWHFRNSFSIWLELIVANYKLTHTRNILSNWKHPWEFTQNIGIPLRYFKSTLIIAQPFQCSFHSIRQANNSPDNDCWHCERREYVMHNAPLHQMHNFGLSLKCIRCIHSWLESMCCAMRCWTAATAMARCRKKFALSWFVISFCFHF